jgi:hypothetical protein
MQELNETTERKPSKGAPKGNQNRATHGTNSARRVLNEFGLRAIDGRSAVGVAVRTFRASLIKDLGGIEALSASKRIVLDKVVVTKFLLDGIDGHLMSKGSAALFSNRGRSLSPIVRERQALADSLLRQLQVLGLERVVGSETPDLQTYMAKKSQERTQ